mmetsp:Transcript_20778/g.45388  ORF Transcript_20778/g.45388 Transcript_20778/m.45388 type:complete len:805 (-) Transcript_20778:802-3216(-)
MFKLVQLVVFLGLGLQVSIGCNLNSDCQPGEFCASTIRGQVRKKFCTSLQDRRMLKNEVDVKFSNMSPLNVARMFTAAAASSIPGVGTIASILVNTFWPTVEVKEGETPVLEREDVLILIESRLTKASWDILKALLGKSRDNVRQALIDIATGGYVGVEQDKLVDAAWNKAKELRNAVVSFLNQLDAQPNGVLKRQDSSQLIDYLIATNSLLMATYRLKYEHLVDQRGDPDMDSGDFADLEHNIEAVVNNTKEAYLQLQDLTKRTYDEWLVWRQGQLNFTFSECLKKAPICGCQLFVGCDEGCVKARLFSVEDKVTGNVFYSDFVYNPMQSIRSKSLVEEYKQDITNRIMNDLKATVLSDMAETLYLQRLIPGQESGALDLGELAPILQSAKLGPYNAWTLGFAVGYDQGTGLWYKNRGDDLTSHKGTAWCHWGGARKRLSKQTCKIGTIVIDGLDIFNQKSWDADASCVCRNSISGEYGYTCQSEGYAFMAERLDGNTRKTFQGPFKSVKVEPSKLQLGFSKDNSAYTSRAVTGLDDFLYTRHVFSKWEQAPHFTGLELYFDTMSGNIAHLRVLAAGKGHVDARYFTSTLGLKKQPFRFARASVSPNFRMKRIHQRKSASQKRDAYLGYSMEVELEFYEQAQYETNMKLETESAYRGLAMRNTDTTPYWGKFDWKATDPDYNPFLVSPNGKYKVLMNVYGLFKSTIRTNIFTPIDAEAERPNFAVRSFCFQNEEGRDCGCHDFANRFEPISDLTHVNSVGNFGLPKVHQLTIYGSRPELTNDGQLLLRPLNSRVTHLVKSAKC